MFALQVAALEDLNCRLELHALASLEAKLRAEEDLAGAQAHIKVLLQERPAGYLALKVRQDARISALQYLNHELTSCEPVCMEEFAACMCSAL